MYFHTMVLNPPGALIEVKNLSVSFGKDDHYFKAVDNISFTIGAGETLGIVGESGSGKSVTSLSLMQLIARPAGRIESGSAVIASKQEGMVDLLAQGGRRIECRPAAAHLSGSFSSPAGR